VVPIETRRGHTPLSAFFALIFLLGVGWLPEYGLAQEGFRWGRIKFHPGVSLETKYNDNIFLEADKSFVGGGQETARDDFIYTTSPSLRIEREKLQGDYFGFVFDYLGKDERFVDLQEQDFFSHEVSTKLNLGNLAGDLNWTLGGGIVKTRFPISVEFAANLNPRQERTMYNVDSNLEWKLTNDIEANIGGIYRRNIFDGDDLQGFERYNGSGTLIWQTTALTGIGVNYSYQLTDYFRDSVVNADSKMHSTSLILRWKPTSIFYGQVWLGFNLLDFDGVVGQDRDDMIYRVELKYQPKSTRIWSLVAFREIPNSFFLDIQAFQKTVTQLNLDQTIGVKWILQAQAAFQVNRYDIAAIDSAGLGNLKLRKDERFLGKVSLTYAIQNWWEIKMDYTYTVNDSNFENFDYSNNIVFLRFSFII
jgi:hypothetical protein